ncbi:MAG: tRNA (adenosine(37)-N6)-threonylcarbamoyltransferase complex ATPase subunit type 1 TsaE [Treponema sp.]|nr:tRNA (adenosine(37)-N6)-threonylcarbamoyltransferase complex ATPase subunit type 1 TsaE [Treponema sp.]
MIQPASSLTSLPVSFLSSSPEETFSLGESFASLLTKGSIVALGGPLGAGKTCFAQGIAKGLGLAEAVTSPTYPIICEYEIFLPAVAPPAAPATAVLYHIDAYRLNGSEDFTAIGGDDIILSDGISLIEWSERIEDSIPPESLRVDIEISKDNKRQIRIYRKGGGI